MLRNAEQIINDAKFRSMGFAYDANGRQVKTVRSGVPDAWTVYDALGNRVATKINDVWQYVVYDAFGKCVAEDGQLADGVGGVKYVQQDWQGSVRTVTNANGFVVSRTDHQAFGGEVGYGTGQRTIDQGYNGDAATRQGYGLTERDDASGLDHTWFRKNESSAGRWTSPDPYNGSMSLSDPQSFNRFSYATNDPVNFVDPSGLVIKIPDIGGFNVEIQISWFDKMWEDHWGADNSGDFGWLNDGFGPSIGPSGGGASGGPSSPPFLERVNEKALNTCLEMLYGLKADQFGASVKLSRSGALSTTAQETTYEANFSVLEPGTRPVAELKIILTGRSRGKGEITLTQASRDKLGDLDAMLLGLGLALADPTMDVGNYEYGAGYKVKRPSTPSSLQDCYRRYAPKS